MTENSSTTISKDPTLTQLTQAEKYKKEVLSDFRISCISREVSLLGRKEVLTGKAKFGIFGGGKEVPQAVMARYFQKGDWRAGYYRDQTFVFATGLFKPEDMFAQLYADTENDPWSGGRQMTGHFNTPTFDTDGEWLSHKELKNISADVSCTAGQMGRALGLALASKKYRENKHLSHSTDFSENGNEVVFCTIGDASTSEGVFWETMNAAGVMKVPLVVSVWDDGYGISVPKEYQTTKASISEALMGMQLDDDDRGIAIYKVKGWDYQRLSMVYEEAVERARKDHIPALIHVEECTQPSGHSTSGSHERYKDADRLAWEKEWDGIHQMGMWLVESKIATQAEIDTIKEEAKKYVKECRDRAWDNYFEPLKKELADFKNIISNIATTFPKEEILAIQKELGTMSRPFYSELVALGRKAKFELLGENETKFANLLAFLDRAKNKAFKRYHTHLFSNSKHAALNVPIVEKQFSDDSPLLNGYEILNKFFDVSLEKRGELLAFGEDVGDIGDVNQGFANMQKKYGEERVFDTGIREWTIMGQAIGLSKRGLRPIAEIQYLDYLVYGLEPLMDDLSTLRWRTNGTQKAPAIIRTRGHRLEGVWHSGSQMAMILNSCKGIYLLTPRDMVQAAGMYNTMLQSDDPAILVECLNGYRLKEKLPDNIGEYTIPLGVPETLQPGSDVTIVTYGSCVRVAQAGIKLLEKKGISVELIDVQTLMPFDLEHRIVESLKKTNRIVFFDEDVPGGATAYMMREVLEKQDGYQYLDSKPVTLTATNHRPPYGSDGDYFSKPNPEDVFEIVYKLMQEVAPKRFLGNL